MNGEQGTVKRKDGGRVYICLREAMTAIVFSVTEYCGGDGEENEERRRWTIGLFSCL